jgi:hypothetical protein
VIDRAVQGCEATHPPPRSQQLHGAHSQSRINHRSYEGHDLCTAFGKVGIVGSKRRIRAQPERLRDNAQHSPANQSMVSVQRGWSFAKLGGPRPPVFDQVSESPGAQDGLVRPDSLAGDRRTAQGQAVPTNSCQVTGSMAKVPEGRKHPS